MVSKLIEALDVYVQDTKTPDTETSDNLTTST